MSDRAGNIYIADKDAHAVRKIDDSGRIHTVAGTGTPGDDGDRPGPAAERRLSSPNGLWVRGDGTIYILDLGNDKIRRVSAAGEMTTLFHVGDGISIGRGLWVAADESLAYVASGSRLVEWRHGKGTRILASGFRSLGSLVVTKSGEVLVTDRAAGAVLAIAPDGDKRTLESAAPQPDTERDTPGGNSLLRGVRAIWIHPDGGLVLGTHESSAVWYRTPTGTLQPLLGSDEVSEVRGISMDHAGNILVVDDDQGLVRRLPRK